MPKYPVLDRLSFDGKDYEAGGAVTIDDEAQAEQLIELGVIGKPDAAAADKAAADKAAADKAAADKASKA